MIYRLLLTQHIGRPALPCVKPEDRVKRGRRVASKPSGKLGAHVHSPVDGDVVAVCDGFIEIEADAWAGAVDAKDEYVPISGNGVLELIAEAGIVGAGGAGFPTAVKLERPLGPEGVLIINAAECEPTLGHNINLLETEPERVLRGAAHALRALDAGRCVVAVKGRHKRAIAALSGVMDTYENISVFRLPDRYPSGEERAVVREVQGRLLAPDRLPFEAGCVVLNAETAARVADATDLRKPVMTKDMTLAGQFLGEAFWDRKSAVQRDVPIGLPLRALIDRAGGLSADFGELICGGPFTGKDARQDDPVTKITGGLLAAMPFLRVKDKLGLLVCACGADGERLARIAEAMCAEVVGTEHCKQSVLLPNGTRKCENPGNCPGQAEKVMSLWKQGARALLISNCSDCTNTVMTLADRMPIRVYHSTDGVLRAAGAGLVRRK
jgi:proline reductase-associated electron transfer protein PrdC